MVIKKQFRPKITKKIFYKGFLGGSFFGFLSFVYFSAPSFFPLSYTSSHVLTGFDNLEKPLVAHMKPPEPLKAIYMSQCVSGTPSFRSDLIRLIDETELNAVVIDIKDYTGKVSFPLEDPLMRDFISDACGATDMKDFIKTLHDKNIYVIGRITVFQDPYYTKLYPEQAVQSKSTNSPWKDYKGLSFVDVSSSPFWDHIVKISEEAYAIGFDELNYDYVRYPSDGPMSDAVFVNPKKPEALELFFEYLHSKIKPTGAILSADLFGMTTTNTDDLNIGQQLERALPYFDYIAPMVYPSHYPRGFNNLGNPNLYPYEIVNFSMDKAVERTISTTTIVKTLHNTEVPSTTPRLYTKRSYSPLVLRPWLQDFDYGGDYDIEEIKAQMKATYDAGLTSWMLWSPSNRYTRGALEGE